MVADRVNFAWFLHFYLLHWCALLYIVPNNTPGGENVYPREVEEFILQCDDVLDVAVFGITDEVMGEQVIAAIMFDPENDARSQCSLSRSRHA